MSSVTGIVTRYTMTPCLIAIQHSMFCNSRGPHAGMHACWQHSQEFTHCMHVGHRTYQCQMGKEQIKDAYGWA